ncbi:hypothetical protein SKAU_G00109950 [Synaphobranchus kaupii]|uniref:Uncharacterized protein n=1 Tax=Synaphobranchus kaupii TaxID=118154 RepID=A0A9Q1J786_SYNKA|nr:hypothetical protein SKAU_G00109950 [Synaphobranchus kaupii]
MASCFAVVFRAKLTHGELRVSIFQSLLRQADPSVDRNPDVRQCQRSWIRTAASCQRLNFLPPLPLPPSRDERRWVSVAETGGGMAVGFPCLGTGSFLSMSGFVARAQSGRRGPGRSVSALVYLIPSRLLKARLSPGPAEVPA